MRRSCSLSGNSIRAAMVILAAQKIGAPAAPISVPYSTMSTDFDKLKHCFDAVKPAVVFAEQLAPFRKALAALPAGAFKIVSAAPEGDNAVLAYDALAATTPTPAVTAARDALTDASIGKYLFTSGSTGMPKPVPQTQGAMCSLISGQEGLKDTSRDPEHDPDRIDSFLDWLPWNHISGSNVNFNGALWNGSTFWIDGGKPTPALFHETIRNIREASPSVFGTAPIALGMLAEAMEQDETLLKAFFKNMRSIGYGGATLSDDLYDRLQALSIKATGRRIPDRHHVRRHRNAGHHRGALGSRACRPDRPAAARHDAETRAQRREAGSARQGPDRHAGLSQRPEEERRSVRRGRLLLPR